MANHGFVTTKKWLTGDRVEEALKDILEERFESKIPYKRTNDYFEIGFECPWVFGFWVENCHKLEFRHASPEWCWWVMCVIQNEFAIRYNGLISDEGVEEKWKGEPNKYPTFRSWIAIRYRNMKNPGKWILERLALLLEGYSSAPDEVKKMIKGQ